MTQLGYFITILGLLIYSAGARPESAKQFLDAQDATRIRMAEMTRQLGTTCVACHNAKDFSDNHKAEYKTALEHMKITQTLIDVGFDGRDKRPKATCYMCHRGNLKPEYQMTPSAGLK